MEGTRRKYTKEFKREAVALTYSPSKTIRKIADDLGINSSMLGRWHSEIKRLDNRAYSIKYRDYQRKIRNLQIQRAFKVVDKNPSRVYKSHQNDYKRFIKKTSVTSDGEIASKEVYGIDAGLIAKEEVFDGFYGVCTNLEDNVEAIIKVN